MPAENLSVKKVYSEVFTDLINQNTIYQAALHHLYEKIEAVQSAMENEINRVNAINTRKKVTDDGLIKQLECELTALTIEEIKMTASYLNVLHRFFGLIDLPNTQQEVTQLSLKKKLKIDVAKSNSFEIGVKLKDFLEKQSAAFLENDPELKKIKAQLDEIYIQPISLGDVETVYMPDPTTFL